MDTAQFISDQYGDDAVAPQVANRMATHLLEATVEALAGLVEYHAPYDTAARFECKKCLLVAQTLTRMDNPTRLAYSAGVAVARIDQRLAEIPVMHHETREPLCVLRASLGRVVEYMAVAGVDHG